MSGPVNGNGGAVSKGWLLGIAVAALLATATFLANATVSQGREISALQANDRTRDREMTDIRTQLRDMNQKLDRLLERGP